MEAISSRPVSSGRTGRTAPGLVLVGIAGLSLGFLTAYAQEWLPDELGSLANSAGSWALVAFTLALLAVDGRTAVSFGCLALVALLIGYMLGANVRGFASGRSLIVFWGAAAVVAGPLIGLAAHRVRTEHGPMAALGIGAISGVLVGEGIYGLAYIADTTYPPYWWGEIIVGVALLTWVAVRRLRQRRAAALAVSAHRNDRGHLSRYISPRAHRSTAVRRSSAAPGQAPRRNVSVVSAPLQECRVEARRRASGPLARVSGRAFSPRRPRHNQIARCPTDATSSRCGHEPVWCPTRWRLARGAVRLPRRFWG